MPLDFRKEALKHIKRLDKYAEQIKQAYDKANKELARIALSVDHPTEELFRIKDHPEIKARVDGVINALKRDTQAVILNGEAIEWGYANKLNDELATAVTGLTEVTATAAQRKRFFNQNQPALDAFQRRKRNGINLSDRVWNLTKQYQSDIEMGLSVGIADGRSAAELSRDLRKFLNEPEKLFRRVRDEFGNLNLSKAALSYSPGQGVYRSSYKNALRVTRTEINMAYRAADQTRWEQMDFVIGYEIKRSNNPYPCPVCEALVGEYPKSFVFTGWHPQCRCVITPILQEMDDFLANEDAILNGEDPPNNPKGEITDVPDNFKKWVNDNQERIEQAKDRGTEPYWVKNNPGYIKVEAKPQDAWSANLSEVEKKLGITRGAEMSFIEANEGRGNTNFGKGKEYGVNCQSCVVSNELRRRGFDVTAMPNLKTEGNIPYELSRRTQWAWIDPSTGMMPNKQKAGGIYDITPTGRLKSKTLKEMSTELNELTLETGRYHIDFGWKTGGAHIITLERLEGGIIRMYDPQTGKRKYWNELLPDLKLQYGVNVLKVDGLMINTDIINGVVVRSG